MADNTAAPNPVAPDWLNSGDNAWQLTAATLVALQSVPGLVVFYAGINHSKWAINSAFMTLYAFAITLLVWELRQSNLPSTGLAQAFPLSTMIYFQFVFTAITVIIMAGALLGRMNFAAWMVFVPLWITFCYTIGAYSIWGGGFLISGWVGAIFLSPRHPSDLASTRSHNILSALVSVGLLWIGWNGLNGGGPYAASPDAGVAVLNTNICTATSLLVWTVCDRIYYYKPSIIGAVNGMICGLRGSSGWGAIAMEVLSGAVPWMSMNLVGRKMRVLRKVDDVLGVLHTHAVASLIGGFCVGLFATKERCEGFGITNGEGVIAGNRRQVWVHFIKYVLRIPLRMTELQLEGGDDLVHRERAYVLGPCDAHVQLEGRSVSGVGSLGENVGVGEGVVIGREVEREKEGEKRKEGVEEGGLLGVGKGDTGSGSATATGSER
ncbi:amt family ammonium transporter protein [Rutstroemia sp. NJR-2017a BVV2]|nr:amt family ammonium transporter protein [Rutstroemia sp. NJR-2017a BVV2]